MKLKGKAYFVKKFSNNIFGSDEADRIIKSSKNVKGKRNIALYKVSPPIKGHQYVVVSSVKIEIPMNKKESHIIQETMVFFSNHKGDVEFGQEFKTFYGFLPHDKVLMDIGYELVEFKLKPETEKYFGDILREL